MFSAIACIRDDHDWRLIVVAAVVCLAGSVATMLLLERARRSAGSQRHLWIAVCAFACGVGVWSTHFIAMLAYDGGNPHRLRCRRHELFHRGRDRGVLGCLFGRSGWNLAPCSGRWRFAARARNCRHARERHARHRGPGTGRIRSGNEFRRRSSRHLDRRARPAFVPGAARRARPRRIHPAPGGRDMRPALHVDERRRPDPRPERRGNARLRSVLAGGRRHRRIDHAHSHGLRRSLRRQAPDGPQGARQCLAGGHGDPSRRRSHRGTNASPLSVVESPPSSSAGNGGSCSPRRPKDGARTTSGPERGQARESSFTRTAGTCPWKGSAERSNTRAGHAT